VETKGESVASVAPHDAAQLRRGDFGAKITRGQMKRKSDGIAAVDDGAAAVSRRDVEFGPWERVRRWGVGGGGGGWWVVVGGGGDRGGRTEGHGQLRCALIESRYPHKVAAARLMAQLEQRAAVDARCLRPPSQQNASEEPETEEAEHRKPKRESTKVIKNGHAPARTNQPKRVISSSALPV
jgi:hypothetical protein